MVFQEANALSWSICGAIEVSQYQVKTKINDSGDGWTKRFISRRAEAVRSDASSISIPWGLGNSRRVKTTISSSNGYQEVPRLVF